MSVSPLFFRFGPGLGLDRRAGEDPFELGGALPSLGAVGLVDDDGIPAGRQLADLLGHERELLERGDDDGRGGRQGLGQLAGVDVDLPDHPLPVLELVDRVLELLVEDEAVGDDDHRIEDLFVRGVVKRSQPVGQPRDGVALAAPGRVLDEAVVADARRPGIVDEPSHRVELVVPREDHGLFLDLPVAGLLLLDLEMDEPGEDVEQAVPVPHLLPEVRGLVPPGVFGIARARAVAQVEGQETLPAPEPGGHVDLVRVHGEMYEGPLLELKDQILGVAVAPVLVDGVPPGLAGHGVLELRRGDGNAVQAEDQVERADVFAAVRKLPGYGQPVGGVKPPCLWIQAARR